MSDYEAYRGKIVPTNMTLEEYVTHRATEAFDDAEEYFWDNYYDDAFIIDGMIYEPQLKSIDVDDLFIASQNDDGSIDILVNFYNGGCGLSDAIEAAIINMKRENK